MGEWRLTTWGDVITLQRGFDITKNVQSTDGAIPVVSSGGISSYHDTAMADGPGVVIGRKGTLGRVHYLTGPYWPHDTTLWVKDFKGNVPRFVYYALKSIDPRYLNVGSASPTLNRNHVHPLPVRWPLRFEEQSAIADVLGALDDKISANDRMLSRIDSLLVAKYEAELRAGYTESQLEDLAAFRNRQRIPLSSREREVRRGSVPYYGAAGRLDFVDEAIFDEPLVLVGEDGSVVTDKGGPVVQYIWGPSWVNNHAHVLTGNGIATETLRCALMQSNVAHLVTGAVQPKISMGNLKRLTLSVPLQSARFDAISTGFAAMTRATSDESALLAHTRDELLPLLMSGNLSVKGAETAASEVL